MEGNNGCHVLITPIRSMRRRMLRRELALFNAHEHRLCDKMCKRRILGEMCKNSGTNYTPGIFIAFYFHLPVGFSILSGPSIPLPCLVINTSAFGESTRETNPMTRPVFQLARANKSDCDISKSQKCAPSPPFITVNYDCDVAKTRQRCFEKSVAFYLSCLFAKNAA